MHIYLIVMFEKKWSSQHPQHLQPPAWLQETTLQALFTILLKISPIFSRLWPMMVTDDNLLVQDFANDGCKTKQTRKRKRKCHTDFLVILTVVRNFSLLLRKQANRAASLEIFGRVQCLSFLSVICN